MGKRNSPAFYGLFLYFGDLGPQPATGREQHREDAMKTENRHNEQRGGLRVRSQVKAGADGRKPFGKDLRFTSRFSLACQVKVPNDIIVL